MKTKFVTVILGYLLAMPLFAQDRTTVNAMSPEISDNLDLRAVASIFGEARNLEDFERQLNDPKIQISNLDLNYDNQVDYLRVIETVEGYTHLIVVQSVLGRNTYQDVATIQVERDANNQEQVQVVGDVYMYGENYIYEPVYVHRPLIFTSFWIGNYRPYSSTWYWNFYPTYYYAWNPFPVFRYRSNVNVYINFNNQYNYVNTCRIPRAVAMYSTRRTNYCETRYPTRSFAYRNTSVRNRYELDQNRGGRNGLRNETAYNYTSNNSRTVSSPTRNYSTSRNESNVRSNVGTVRDYGNIRSNDGRTNNNERNSASLKNEGSVRSKDRVENGISRLQGRTESNSVRDYLRPQDGGRAESNPIRQQHIQTPNIRTNEDSQRQYSTRPAAPVRMNQASQEAMVTKGAVLETLHRTGCLQERIAK